MIQAPPRDAVLVDIPNLFMDGSIYFQDRDGDGRLSVIAQLWMSCMVSGHKGHKPNGQNLNGHKPKRPQTGTTTYQNGQKPKRPQTETSTNCLIHGVETLEKITEPQTVLIFYLFVYVFANCIHVSKSICTTGVGISGKAISYSKLLVYSKKYAHGFICFVVFILRIRLALMYSIYPYFPGLIYLQCDGRVIVELAFNMLRHSWGIMSKCDN